MQSQEEQSQQPATMGKKKVRPFIDKKHASTYTLLHRSQAELALLSEPGRGGGELDGNVVVDVSTSNMVLWPTSSNSSSMPPGSSSSATHGVASGFAATRDAPKPSSALHEWKLQLQQARLVLDEQANGNRYLKERSGDGVFISAPGVPAAATASNSSTSHRQLATTILPSNHDDDDEVNPPLLFENVDLTTDCLDEDMAALLLGEDGDGDPFEEGADSLLGLEELDDDFCFQAAQEPDAIAGTGTSTDFDYDAHVRQLLERARREAADGPDDDDEYQRNHHPGAHDRDYFRSLRPLRGGKVDNEGDCDDEQSEFDEDALVSWMQAPGVVPKLAPEEERALCEKFEATLAEYDSSEDESDDVEQEDADDAGDECDNPAGEVEGLHYGPRRELQGDRELEAALDDFLTEKRDDILVQGTKAPRESGSGYSALVGTRMIPASQLLGDGALGSDEVAEPVDVILAQANEVLAQPIQTIPPEEIILIEEDGKSYLSERSRNPWDCESILSTYSNLDNNPVVIEHRRRQPTKAKQIVLSQKTGLPILQTRVQSIPEDEVDDGTAATVNRGAARKKGESADEKRARKGAAKRERQVARLQKQTTRRVFEQEFQKRAVVTDTIAGNAVFRYS